MKQKAIQLRTTIVFHFPHFNSQGKKKRDISTTHPHICEKEQQNAPLPTIQDGPLSKSQDQLEKDNGRTLHCLYIFLTLSFLSFTFFSISSKQTEKKCKLLCRPYYYVLIITETRGDIAIFLMT